MKKEKALEIAGEFLHDMNPEGWNGQGEKPASFNDKQTWESEEKFLKEFGIEMIYEISEGDGQWSCYIDAIDVNCTAAMISTHKINDQEAIAQAIIDTEEELIRLIMKGSVKLFKRPA